MIESDDAFENELDADEVPVEDDNPEQEDMLLCPSCRRQVHEDTQQCPHCGDWITPVSDEHPLRRWLMVAIAVLLILTFVLPIVL
ncbi:MAG: hypothetical protein AABZ12_07955 [Planctomycetota bacterium]